jgi:chemotaxis signal transduction protein
MVDYAALEKVKEKNEKYLLFNLDNGLYALHTDYTREILKIPTLTVLPMMPRYIKGIAAIRGEIVLAVDMREKLGLHPLDGYENRLMIISQYQKRSIGLIVDSIYSVEKIPEEKLSCIIPKTDALSKNGALSKNDELFRIVKMKNDITLVIDPELFFNSV